MSDATDPTRLLCAWCGGEVCMTRWTPVETHYDEGVRWGWHAECPSMDPIYTWPSALSWPERRAIIEARGPGRVGKIDEVGSG